MEFETKEYESTLDKSDFDLNLSPEDKEKAEALKEELKTLDKTEKLEAAIEMLKLQLEEKNTVIQSLEESYLREKAEVENFKRRMREEQAALLKYANQGLMTELLPVLDGFTNALNSATKTEETEAFFNGFEMIQGQMKQALRNAGLEEVPVDGAFDPNVHQAIMTDTVDGYEDDQIIETMMRGYKLHDRTLRAAMVKVNKK